VPREVTDVTRLEVDGVAVVWTQDRQAREATLFGLCAGS
jgi:hypothetical protein